MVRAVSRKEWRPYLILVATIALLSVVDWGGGDFASAATAFGTLQSFSTFGLVALGLGLTLIVGEFDLSVAGVFGLAGCVAVLVGNGNAALGFAAAICVGALFGFLQGGMITLLGLGSVPVTLGGLLVATGLSYVLTQNQVLSFNNLGLALALNGHILKIFSPRSIFVLALFAIAAVGFSGTRIGRDLVAMGSDRRAAVICGVGTKKLLIAVFTVSGALAAISGAVMSYGLASASPTGLSDVLVPAITSCILGGVSLSGGLGRPLGIAAGTLTVTVLRSGLNALGSPPFAHELMTGGVLLLVAITDAPYFTRQLQSLLSEFRIGTVNG